MKNWSDASDLITRGLSVERMMGMFEIFKRTAAAISRGKILSSSVCAGSCASIFCVMGVAGVITAFGQVRTLRPRPRRMN